MPIVLCHGILLHNNISSIAQAITKSFVLFSSAQDGESTDTKLLFRVLSTLQNLMICQVYIIMRFSYIWVIPKHEWERYLGCCWTYACQELQGWHFFQHFHHGFLYDASSFGYQSSTAWLLRSEFGSERMACLASRVSVSGTSKNLAFQQRSLLSVAAIVLPCGSQCLVTKYYQWLLQVQS